MIGDPALTELTAGDRVSLVVETTDKPDLCLALWNRELYQLDHELQEGVWTIYSALFVSCDQGIGKLHLDEESTTVLNKPLGPTSFSVLKEVCGGIGGIAIGAAQAGMHTVASLDHCLIANQTLGLNGGTPINGDAQALGDQITLHQVPTQDAHMLSAGIPCQPYSVQGACQGLSDVRGQVLLSVLQIGWRQQISGLILECVSNITNFKDTMDVLIKFAHDLGFNFSQVELDLAHQWASRRKRWWCVMLPQRLPRLTLLAWPVRNPPFTTGEVLGELPDWGVSSESALAWTSEETEYFSDPACGTEGRILEWNGQAPTALHSWGAAFTPCPCRCRLQPFSIACLESRGLRGVGVFSSSSGLPRHLHAAEVGLLNSLPVTYKHLPEARTALCLVGNLAAPLQSAWVCAQIAEWSQVTVGPTGASPPLQVLSDFQDRLLQERRDLWPRPSQAQGGVLRTTRDGIQLATHICSQIKVSDLIAIYKEVVGPGFLVKVFEGERRLPHEAFLLTGDSAPTYEVQAIQKRQAKPIPDCPPCGLPGFAFPQVDPEVRLHEGTSEVAIWCGLKRAQALFRVDSCAIAHPFEVTEATLGSSGPCISTTIAQHFWPAGSSSCCLAFVHQGHWSLLMLGCTSDHAAEAFLYDGLEHAASHAGQQLATALCRARGFVLQQLHPRRHWRQTDGTSCGAILLAHAAFAFSGESVPSDSLLAEASAFVQHFPPHTARLYGKGPLSDAQNATLQALLVEKGVPQDQVAERVKAAVTKVGGASIAQALQAKNVWQSLKAIASKPGVSFMWVQHSELQAAINRKAQEKFGISVPQPKQKKQPKSRAGQRGSPLHIDPQQLQLVAGSLVSSQGSPLCQLSIGEVTAQASGICFCSAAQAAPFLANLHSISTEALGLLTTSELPEDATGLASVSSLRFPAIFTPTGEGVLVKGSLIQLGDEQVQVAQDNIAEVDTVATVTVKVTVYRDELSIPWEQFATGPIKHLLQALPTLSVCKDSQCKQDCQRYHPPVDEPTEQFILDIWGRSFSKLEGGREPASTAAVFTSFWRVPLAALAHIHRLQFAGLYLEPRAADGGPHNAFAVIWLPGDLSAALRAMRTTERVIAVARLGRRYGVRCKEPDEQRIFEHLRPQHKFLKLRVNGRYRIHPLPHGIQRGSLQQLLQNWGWAAKPLQPLRGDIAGSAWEVGASAEPPSLTLPLAGDFVLVTKQKEKSSQPATTPAVLASTRTRKHLIYDDEDPPATAATPWDPWQGGQDPWSKARLGAPPGLPHPPTSVAAPNGSSSTKLDQLKHELSADLSGLVKAQVAASNSRIEADQSATEQRFQKLECGLQELKAQNTKFETWFQEAGARSQQQADTLQAVQSTLQAQKQEISAVRSDLTQGMQQAIGSLKLDLSGQISSQLDGHLEQIQNMLGQKKPRTE